MRIVILREDCVVGGIPRVAGEVVRVSDNFETNKIKRVLKIKESKKNKDKVKKHGTRDIK